MMSLVAVLAGSVASPHQHATAVYTGDGVQAPFIHNYTVLKDTDFYGFNTGSQLANSFDACVQECWARPSCQCVSWNGPESKIKDSNCNFHCSTEGKSLTAVVASITPQQPRDVRGLMLSELAVLRHHQSNI
jgi:hypothetical protein